MNKLTRIVSLLSLSALIAGGSLLSFVPIASAKTVAVKAHTMKTKSGKIVLVKSHTRTVKPTAKTVMVKGYDRTTKSGKVVHVKAYTRKAAKSKSTM